MDKEVLDREGIHAIWDFVVGNGVLTTTMIEEFAVIFATFAAAKEREACAKICDERWSAAECAEAIRARYEQ